MYVVSKHLITAADVFQTVHLIYEGRLSEGEASIAIMKGKIEGLLGRFKTISIAGQSRRFHSLVRADGESAFATFTIV
jgi:hypothetical protein